MHAANADPVSQPAERGLEHRIPGEHHGDQQHRHPFIKSFVHAVQRQQGKDAGVKEGEAEDPGGKYRQESAEAAPAGALPKAFAGASGQMAQHQQADGGDRDDRHQRRGLPGGADGDQ